MSEIKVNSIKGVGATAAAITVNNTDGTCTANITNNLSNRNLIINGAMQVAQRGSASSTTNGLATVDRFKKIGSGLGNTFSQEQITLSSSDTPYSSGFRKAFRVSQNQAGTANAAGAIDFSHYIEAQNLTDSGWNYTSASSKITLQFWFRASTNQTFYAVIYTQDGTKQIYPFAFTASGNNAWTKITHTIPGNSNITINNDNGTGIIIYLIPYYGTDYTDNGMNASAWNTYSNNFCPDMASTWLTAGASTFDVTGMQLEVGSVATDFEHRSFAQELQLCQRYYYRESIENTEYFNGLGKADSDGNSIDLNLKFPVTMRTTPTAVEQAGSGTNYLIRGSSTLQCTGVPTYGDATQHSATIRFTKSSHGISTNNVANCGAWGASFLGFSAEL